MSKGHHALQEEGFCNGISEIKNDIHVNSFVNGLKMAITSLTFNVIRNSVYYCQGAQKPWLRSKGRPSKGMGISQHTSAGNGGRPGVL